MPLRPHFVMAGLLVASLSVAGLRAEQDSAGDAARIEQSNNTFLNFGFGAGLSLTVDTGSDDRIEDAVIDANGIVRVNKKKSAQARVMLETHYLFQYKGDPKCEEFKRGWGPFVAVQPGEGEIIKAAGIGVLFAWRRVPALKQATSFNIGIGYVVDPNTKGLGDEFREGKLAPKGPDGNFLPLRFQERDQGGILVLASFGWF